MRRLLGRPLIELGVGCAGAVIVAAVLGTPTLLITTAGLVVALATAFAGRKLADSTLATVAVPLLSCWMVALSLSGAPEALPAAVGASLAVAASAAFVVERTGRRLVLQLAPQLFLTLCVIVTGWTLAALLVGLCVFAQALWAPALAATERRTRYFQSLQVTWAVVVLVAALAVGARR